MSTECRGPQCTKPVRSAGLCRGHYNQRLKGRELSVLKPWNRNARCEIAGCDAPVNAQKLCHAHYRRMTLGLDMTTPIRPKGATGSGYVSREGYRYVYRDGRSVLEHRMLMSDLLGRPLLPGETVHHVNGDRSDNRIGGPLRVINGKLRSGNLELWSTRQPTGQEIPAKVAWAQEILALYGDLIAA